MTPAEANVLIDRVGEEIEAALAEAFAQYQALVRAGTAPRDAIETVMENFQGEMAQSMAVAFSEILQKSVTVPEVLSMKVGTVTLSKTLYDEAETLGKVVQGITQKHVLGFVDARKLALDLYEGYGFRPVEVLTFAKSNDLIPRYLREALLPDLGGEFDKAFAKLAVENLSTPELRAAYRDVLRALEALEAGKGDALLTRKLRVAFEEKARYLAKRIAQTELHRAFAIRQAKELLDASFIQYVQWRLSASHPREDICDLFAEVDYYGLGGGVYPKDVAPVPTAHPFCRCFLLERIDLNGREPKYRANAHLSVFARRDDAEAARLAGSRDKLERIVSGEDPLAVHNEKIPEAYKIKPVSEIAKLYESLPEQR